MAQKTRVPALAKKRIFFTTFLTSSTEDNGLFIFIYTDTVGYKSIQCK